MQWRIISLRAQKFPPSPKLHLSKALTKWLPTWPCRRPPQVFPAAFSTHAIFKETFRSFSTHGAALMTKSELLIPVFCVRFIHFAVEFCFLCYFIFHDKWHSIQVWQLRDLPKPIAMLCQRIATNGIASFCIDHRWRQMAFFRVFQNGKGPTFVRLTWNKATFIWMQSLILYYI